VIERPTPDIYPIQSISQNVDTNGPIQHLSPANTTHPAFQSDGTHRAYILLPMDYALQPQLYKNVPVYLWPWVWWQLFQIERWIKETGRMVLGGVARDGKVYVLHVADDPSERKPWSPNKPDLSPWNRVPGERRDLVRLVTGIAFDPTRFGDQLALAMRLLEWPLMSTLVGCNEPLRIAPPALAQPPPLSFRMFALQIPR